MTRLELIRISTFLMGIALASGQVYYDNDYALEPRFLGGFFPGMFGSRPPRRPQILQIGPEPVMCYYTSVGGPGCPPIGRPQPRSLLNDMFMPPLTRPGVDHMIASCSSPWSKKGCLGRPIKPPPPPPPPKRRPGYNPWPGHKY